MREYGRYFDLRERLNFVEGQSGRPISFMFGSGLSNKLLPSTTELTRRFIQRTSAGAQQRFESSEQAKAGGAIAYQEAARVLSLHQGDSSVAVVLRQAVLEACASAIPGSDLDESGCREIVRDGDWKIPDGYLRFADYYAGLANDQRGVVSTTNFDPFLELALRHAGLQADALPLPFDNPPSVSAWGETSALQVVHIHGYFSSGQSLNTVKQLSSARPATEEFLQKLYSGTSIVVMGYGGWDDAFSRVLARHAAYQTLVNAEVVWAANTDDPSEILRNTVLTQLDGQPGFQLFVGIDGHRIFDAGRAPGNRRTIGLLPRGYKVLPVAETQPRSAVDFSQGSSPSWDDATPERWPQLQATRDLGAVLAQCIDAGHGAAGAIGPMGEGKSTAIKQLALQAAQKHPDLTVIWREPGAAALDQEMVSDLRRNGPLLMVIDDADLALTDLMAMVPFWSTQDRGVVTLLSCHDRLWEALPSNITRQVRSISLEGLQPGDAQAIAQRWDELGIATPIAGRTGDVGQVARELERASMHNQRSTRTTLFGAILQVREAKSLEARIDRLMQSLESTVVSTRSAVNLADIFGSICVLQHYMDLDGSGLRGATRDHVAQLASSDDPAVSRAVLGTLGREASITYTGNRVYARHPKIAESVVRWLKRNSKLNAVCEMTGMAGARMRANSLVSTADYDSYMLWKSVTDEEAALAAARGAVKGAPTLLEPKINFMVALRKHEKAELASAYGRALANDLTTLADRNGAVRVYLTEFSNVSLLVGESAIAAGLAALSMHAPAGSQLTARGASFSLTSLVKALSKLTLQRSTAAIRAMQTLAQIAVDTGGQWASHSRELQSISLDPDLARLSSGALSTRLATQMSPLAKQAIAELRLPFGVPTKDSWLYRFGGTLQFDSFDRI
jgi:hypothetical protein